jgi:hypothetical protein
MVGVGNRTLLALLIGIGLCLGCSRQAERTAKRTDRLVWTAPDWGPQTDGVQCRLRPTKRLWQRGETPTFKLDLHNRGKRQFAFDVCEPIRPDRVAVDGRWHHRRRDEMRQAKVRLLGPGVEFIDLKLSLPAAMALPLGPGRHTIQIALDLEDLTVLSNPVGIEIADPPASGIAVDR